MSKPARARYKTTNWRDYNAALKRRGSLTIWLDPQMQWEAMPSGRRARQQVFSDAAIQTCLTMVAGCNYLTFVLHDPAMADLPYPLPVDEEKRLRALDEYRLMDTPEEADFDRLVHLAASLFDVPTVLISLVGHDRQFFKARVGLDVCETSREVSFW